MQQHQTLDAGAPLDLPGTHNFRSTAGYPADGGTLRTDGLFRSDALHRLTDVGLGRFAEQGISRVIDLRGTAEAGAAPNRLPEHGVEEVLHPIFDDAGVPGADAEITLAALYSTIAEKFAGRLVEAVRLIADAPDGAVLVHCTAGKDRTGMVVAAALTAVGVSREQILADYAPSGANLAGVWAERMLAQVGAHLPGPLPENVRELVLDSPPAALAEGLDTIDRVHGGAEAMLRTHGFDDATLARLRERLVVAD